MRHAAFLPLLVCLLGAGCLADDGAGGGAAGEVGCDAGETRICGRAAGVCFLATQTCVEGSWQACPGELALGPEVCDGLDNDCNGAVDDDPACERDGGPAPSDAEASPDGTATPPDLGQPVPVAPLLSLECGRLVLGSGPADALSPDTLLLGALLPLSGALAEIGLDMRLAAELAVGEIGAAGGVHGQPLGLLICDTAAEGGVTARILRHLDTLDTPSAIPGVVGPATSAVTTHVVASARELDLLLVSPSATSPALAELDDDGLLWRVAPSDRRQARAMGALLAHERPAAVAVVRPGDAFGQAMSDALRQELLLRSEAPPPPIVELVVQASAGRLALTNAAEELAAQAPAAVALLIHQPAATGLLEELTARNIIGPQGGAALLLAESLATSEVGAVVRAAGVEALVQGVRPQPPAGAVYDTFVATFVRLHGREPGPFAAHAYDATYLLALARASAASAAAEAVSAAALGTALARLAGGPQITPGVERWPAALQALAGEGGVDYLGASGTLDWSPEEREAPGSVVLWRFVGGEPRNGAVVWDDAGRFVPPAGE